LILENIFGKMLDALKKRTVPDFAALCPAEIDLKVNYLRVDVKDDGAGGKTKKQEENKCQSSQ
jgi:hypothetical protein